MNVRSIRLFDRFLGVPACALLTLIRTLAAGKPGRNPPAVKKILFIKLVEQGSTVLARPAFAAAAARVGRENVYCLVLEEYRGILDLMGIISEENVIAVRSGSPWATVVGLARAIRIIRRLGIDAVVDLEFFARTTAVISLLTGATARAGLHGGPGSGPWRGNLLTHPVLYQPDLHTAQLFAVLVMALDRPAAALPALAYTPPRDDEGDAPIFRPAAADVERVSAILGLSLDAGRPPLFLLNANAGDLEPLRRWPEERYVELARLILDRDPAARVAFTGSPGEAAATEAIVSRVSSPRCVSLAGRTTLRDLLTLLALADVLVTNDSGPGHFASITAGRAVVLFGPETPRRWGPRSSRCRALFAGLACSPCLSAHNNRQSACRDNICLQGLGTGEVLRAVDELLASTPAGSGRPPRGV